MHHVSVQRRRCRILGEQGDLSRVLASLVERLDQVGVEVLTIVRRQAVLWLSRAFVGGRLFRRTLRRKNVPPGFQNRWSFRKALGRHRKRFSQLPTRCFHAFQGLTDAAGRRNFRKRRWIANVGVARKTAWPVRSAIL